MWPVSDHQTISNILCGARRVAVAERDSYLEDSCGGDTALRLELERLLKADAELNRESDVRPAKSAAEVPDRVGRYHLQRELGRGGFGRVYLGRDEQLQRRVAVKIPRCDQVSTPEQFLTEARNLAAVAHRHIVTIYDFGQTRDGVCYAVYEYVEGDSLASRANKDRFDHRTAVAHTAKIARALVHVHAQAIYHRDIKPANILLDADDEPLLADFGLAVSERDWRLNIPVSGTPDYMSPEQARGESQVDGRSDIFSLGAVLYELLTGHRPFAGTGVREVLMRVQTKHPRPPREYDASIAAELQQICLRALAKDPGDRYQTVSDFAAALEGFLANDAGQGATGSTLAERSNETPRVLPDTVRPDGLITKSLRSAGQRWAWPKMLSVAVIAVIVTAAFVWTIGRWRDEQPSASQFAPVPSPTHDPQVIRVGVKPWVGYSPLAVAQALELCDPVEIKFVPIDNLEQAQRALDRNEIDVGMWLVDTHAQARAKGISTKVVLKLDVSRTADGIVARDDIKTFQDLVGKRVAFQQEDASHYLLLALCDKYGVDINEIVPVIVDTPAAAAERFVSGEGENRVDAAVTYDPHLQDATRMDGAHLLASAADVSDTIVDVLTVQQDYLNSYPENVEALVRGWFEAVRILSDPTHTDHARAVSIACAFNGKPGGAQWRVSHPCRAADYYAMAAGIDYGDEMANCEFFQRRPGSPSRYDDSFNRGQDVWFELGRLTKKTKSQEGDGSGVTLRVLSHSNFDENRGQ